jgi:glucose/arabinose dehydrogenase
MRRRHAAAAAALLVLAVASSAEAAPTPVPLPGTFAQPVHVSGPPGDASRVFVVEKEGAVQLVVDGQRTATPFLDITDSVNADGERGLLSIAFPHDYAATGLFYVFYTANDGDLVVMEGKRAANDPNVSDPAHRRTLFTIEHSSATNHNGGQLAFGPDGALYVSTGDGASTPANAQDAGSRLGKILRVDPRVSPDPAVWALGLRNPWRFSFDRTSGDMWIGDVGAGTAEEIDFAPAGAAGRNYGWPNCEANVPDPCPVAGAIAPIVVLPRDAPFRSVVAGVVVRDPALPTLGGRFLFGDHFQTTLHSVAANGTDRRPEPDLPVTDATAVSEDGCGHIHVASIGGAVYRIQDGALGACVVPPTPPGPTPGTPPPGTPPPTADTRGCGITVSGQKRTQRILRRGKRLRLRLRSDEACTVIVRAKRFRTKTLVLPANEARTVRLKASKRGLRKLRRQLERSDKRRIRVTVQISARDTAGNFGVRRVRPRVR